MESSSDFSILTDRQILDFSMLALLDVPLNFNTSVREANASIMKIIAHGCLVYQHLVIEILCSNVKDYRRRLENYFQRTRDSCRGPKFHEINKHVNINSMFYGR